MAAAARCAPRSGRRRLPRRAPRSAGAPRARPFPRGRAARRGLAAAGPSSSIDGGVVSTVKLQPRVVSAPRKPPPRLTSTRCSPSGSAPGRSVWVEPLRVARAETSLPSSFHRTLLAPVTVNSSFARPAASTCVPRTGPVASRDGAKTLCPPATAAVRRAIAPTAASATTRRRRIVAAEARERQGRASTRSFGTTGCSSCEVDTSAGSTGRSRARGSGPSSSKATIDRAADRSAAVAPRRAAVRAHFKAADRSSALTPFSAAASAVAAAACVLGVSPSPPSAAHCRTRCKCVGSMRGE